MSKRARDESMEHMKTDEIRKIVTEIVCAAGTPKDKEKIFRKRHPEFAERYSALFEMVCSPSPDMQKLLYMLELREKVMTQERTIDDASKEVGQTLFDEYVKPVLPLAKQKQ